MKSRLLVLLLVPMRLWPALVIADEPRCKIVGRTRITGMHLFL